MTKGEFLKEYADVVLLTMQYSDKSRKEGLLSLEKELCQEKIDERDIFHLGFRLVLDRIDSKLLEKILSNIVKQEKDQYIATIKNMKKAAVLSIKDGWTSRMVYMLLDSYIDLTSEELHILENKLFNAIIF